MSIKLVAIQVDVMSDLRNSKAHGSSMLLGDCLHHISSCADFVNQLFPDSQTHNKSMVHQPSKLGLDLHFAPSALHYGRTLRREASSL